MFEGVESCRCVCPFECVHVLHVCMFGMCGGGVICGSGSLSDDEESEDDDDDEETGLVGVRSPSGSTGM